MSIQPIGALPAKVWTATSQAVGHALKAADEFTKPRADTQGNLEKSGLVQTITRTVEDGVTMMGVGVKALFIIPSGVAATYATRWASQHFESPGVARAVGILAGAVVGTGMMAASAAILGSGALLPVLAAGALVGGLQGMRADPKANIRDSTVGGAGLTLTFVPGVGKVAGAVGAGVGASQHSKVMQVVLGGATGAALGLAVGLLGLGGGVVVATLCSAAAGALGPTVGPRFNQGVRNLANSLAKWGERHSDMDAANLELVAAIPACILGETMDSFLLSGAKWEWLFLGSAPEIIQNIDQQVQRNHARRELKTEMAAGEISVDEARAKLAEIPLVKKVEAKLPAEQPQSNDMQPADQSLVDKSRPEPIRPHPHAAQPDTQEELLDLDL